MNRRNFVTAVPAAVFALTALRALAQPAPAEGAAMRFKAMGKSELQVSLLGLGCNNFGAGPGGRPNLLDVEGTRAVVHAAYDSGVTFFDTAESYGVNGGSEICLGEALKDRRKNVILATKWGGIAARAQQPGWGKGDFIRTALEGSLKRLQTDYIDLYQLHFYDEATPIAETLEACDKLVREGKVRYIGASNFTAAQLEDADKIARDNGWARFISVQNLYSLLETGAEADVLPMCDKLGIGFIPFFPLASGLLTGKYRRNQPAPEGSRLENRPISDADYDKVEALENFAQERGRTILELAFAGLASNPQVASVIAGATKPEQVRQNATAVGWQLTSEELADLRKLTSASSAS